MRTEYESLVGSMQVASLAGIPSKVVSAGGHAAAEMEDKLATAFEVTRRCPLTTSECQALAKLVNEDRSADASERLSHAAEVENVWHSLQVRAVHM